MNSRIELIFKSLKTQGDFQKMKAILEQKEDDPMLQKTVTSVLSGVITIEDEDYPEYFKELDCPPLVLYYYGERRIFKLKNRLGVIGTREPTSGGEENLRRTLFPMVEKFAFAAKEFVLVNGMARGIDILAARIAKDYNLPLIMFLGSGIERPYPLQAQDVYDYCKRGSGLVVSEYPQDVEPRPEHFPFRNRLIVAASQALYVPEAYLPSGTSSSVRWALEMGRSVAASPLTLNKADSLNNTIIKEGADMILDAEDLEEFLLGASVQFS